MPGEPILVVDDAPINLKLTRILLEHEGYDVRTATCAEEALQVLESFRPRLVLADIQMPGVDGLEMTRRIKQDPRNRDVLVVALTALAMEGDEESAIAAGCDGYITKPIDTRRLAERVRGYLQEGAAVPAGDVFSLPDIEGLRARFLDEARQQVPLWLEQLDRRFNAAEALSIAHQWVGTGGLLGFSRISVLAQATQSILRQKPLDVSELRENLAALLDEFQAPSMSGQQVTPGAVADTAVGGPSVLIAAVDEYLSAVGKALFENQGIECRTITDGPEVLAAIREFQPRAVVLDVDIPPMNGYEILTALRAEESAVKILLLTPKGHPEKDGADDFLVKPFNPVELVVRVKKWL
jgi:two-component system cell cycle response regulator DivK